MKHYVLPGTGFAAIVRDEPKSLSNLQSLVEYVDEYHGYGNTNKWGCIVLHLILKKVCSNSLVIIDDLSSIVDIRT